MNSMYFKTSINPIEWNFQNSLEPVTYRLLLIKLNDFLIFIIFIKIKFQNLKLKRNKKSWKVKFFDHLKVIILHKNIKISEFLKYLYSKMLSIWVFFLIILIKVHYLLIREFENWVVSISIYAHTLLNTRNF